MLVGVPEKNLLWTVASVPRRRIPHSAGKGQVLTDVPTDNSLSTLEVRTAIYSYQETAVTDQLYAFGSILLAEIQDRTKEIDGKAVMVLGWSLAVLAFLLTQTNNLGGIVATVFAAISATLALAAAVCAYMARATLSVWAWPSDKVWFQAKVLQLQLGAADELKRFHIRSMHATRQAQLALTERKGKWLSRSETPLVLSAVALGAAVLSKLFISAGFQTVLLF
jgi:hypothetical protein